MINDNSAEKLTPLDVLRRDGWCKGDMSNEQGERCIIGATRVLGEPVFSRQRDAYLAAVLSVISEQFPERMGRSFIGDFNDHPDTTFADVEAVCEKAELRLAEQVSP